MIADKWSEILFENFSIKYDLNSSENSLLEEFINSRNFSELFPLIVKDSLVYGDSFVEYKQSNSGSILLERIEIANMQINISTKKYDYIFSFKDQKNRILENDKIIHFQRQSFMPPFGDSIYGYWFHIWNNIKEHFDRLNQVGFKDRNIETFDSLNKIRQMWEREAISGSGLPLTFFNRYLIDHPATAFNMSFLDATAERTRQSIQIVVEREIFPLFLNRNWGLDFPEFIIKGKLNLD
jgi:hypothetical protein